MAISEIIILESNPRDISPDNLNNLESDILRDPDFLIQRPPLLNLVDGIYYCYAGAQRIKACKNLGYTSIICFVEENVDPKVQDQRMLQDNLHRGKWNAEKLNELQFDMMELQELGLNEIDFNGFDDNMPFPSNLTAEKKNGPPTIKITFTDEPQMRNFIEHLKEMENHFNGITYSVSLGEI